MPEDPTSSATAVVVSMRNGVPIPPGRDEMNIAEFPITLLCDRAPKGQYAIEFKDEIHDPKSGRSLVRNLTITVPEKYGLPTSTDDDVILALLQLTKQQNNFTNPEVHFTRRQLIEVLGWPHKGASYGRICQSLDRWSATHLKYQNAWWDNEGRRWTNGAFHIIDEYKISDARALERPEESFCRITWGKVFFKSCQAGYLKSLDYGFYVQLKLHTSKRMYRFLDKRFYHKAEWTFDLRDFAFEHIGLSRSYAHNGKIKEKLGPAVEELEEAGFLEPMPREQRFRKSGRDWVVVFRRGRAVKDAADETPPTSHPLVKELTARGVTESTACELTQQFLFDRIATKVDVFDWMTARGDSRLAKSPAGYLVASIRRDYAPPKGFVPRAERDRLAVAKATAQQVERDRKARLDRDEAARRAEDKAVAEYWATLSPLEQEALDEAASALADPEALAANQGLPAFERAYRASLRRKYVLDILRLDPDEAAVAAS